MRLTQFSGLVGGLGGLHLEVKKESPLKEQVSIDGNGANVPSFSLGDGRRRCLFEMSFTEAASLPSRGKQFITLYNF